MRSTIFHYHWYSCQYMFARNTHSKSHSQLDFGAIFGKKKKIFFRVCGEFWIETFDVHVLYNHHHILSHKSPHFSRRNDMNIRARRIWLSLSLSKCRVWTKMNVNSCFVWCCRSTFKSKMTMKNPLEATNATNCRKEADKKKTRTESHRIEYLLLGRNSSCNRQTDTITKHVASHDMREMDHLKRKFLASMWGRTSYLHQKKKLYSDIKLASERLSE